MYVADYCLYTCNVIYYIQHDNIVFIIRYYYVLQVYNIIIYVVVNCLIGTFSLQYELSAVRANIVVSAVIRSTPQHYVDLQCIQLVYNKYSSLTSSPVLDLVQGLYSGDNGKPVTCLITVATKVNDDNKLLVSSSHGFVVYGKRTLHVLGSQSTPGTTSTSTSTMEIAQCIVWYSDTLLVVGSKPIYTCSLYYAESIHFSVSEK